MSIVVFALTFLTMCVIASAGLSIIAYLESSYVVMVIFSISTLTILYVIIRILVDVYRWMNPQ